MRTDTRLPATESRNPRSRGLDRMSALGILRVMNREDARVPRAVSRALPQIARAVERIVAALRRGGRLFYIGAGTSGRLAVLDASECPPTFGVPPTLVQGIIAGGSRALVRAVEGAEDSPAQGRRDLAARRLSPNDVVVGLTASGSTPYVLGALEYARRRGAATVAITCNRNSRVATLAGITIAVEVGPEVVAGSTRLKAGTAQKLVLNMLSTAAMVRLGYVYDNWMINVAQSNRKLRQRALRILVEASGASVDAAARTLRQAGHNLRVALVMLLAGTDAARARAALRLAGNDVRKALARCRAIPARALAARKR